MSECQPGACIAMRSKVLSGRRLQGLPGRVQDPADCAGLGQVWAWHRHGGWHVAVTAAVLSSALRAAVCLNHRQVQACEGGAVGVLAAQELGAACSGRHGQACLALGAAVHVMQRKSGSQVCVSCFWSRPTFRGCVLLHSAWLHSGGCFCMSRSLAAFRLIQDSVTPNRRNTKHLQGPRLRSQVLTNQNGCGLSFTLPIECILQTFRVCHTSQCCPLKPADCPACSLNIKQAVLSWSSPGQTP